MSDPRAPGPRKTLGVGYQVQVIDKDGNIKEEVSGANSILTNFIQAIWSSFVRASVTLTDTAGTSRVGAVNCYGVTGYNTAGLDIHRSYTYTAWGGIKMAAAAADANIGIVVGNGDTAVTAADYTLAGKIAHGSSTDQLNYGAETMAEVDFNSPNVRLVISRPFTNGGAAAVTVSEIGVVGSLTALTSAQTPYYFQMIRDVLPSSITLGPGDALVVKYTIYTGV
jgi:hypothetical protein